jgi:hypothetical protein
LALLIIAGVAIAMGLAGARATRGTYLAISLVTLAVSWYAFTR